MEEVQSFDVTKEVPGALEICCTNTHDIVVAGLTSVAIYDGQGHCKARRDLDECTIGRGVTVCKSGHIMVTASCMLTDTICDSCSCIYKKKGIVQILDYSLKDAGEYFLMTKCACHFQESIRLTDSELVNCETTTINEMDNGILCVCDGGNNCLYIIQNGACKKRISDVIQPDVVVFTATGDILVSDLNDNVIKVFGLDCKLKHKFRLKKPYGIALDGRDRIIAADPENHRVLLFDSKGNYLSALIQNTLEEDLDIRPYCVSTSKNKDRLAVLLHGLPGIGITQIRIYVGLESFKNNIACSDLSGLPNAPNLEDLDVNFPQSPSEHAGNIRNVSTMDASMPEKPPPYTKVFGNKSLKTKRKNKSGRCVCS